MRKHLVALGESDVDVPMLEKYAVKDQVDLEIMERVRQAGAQGVFPKDVAKDPVLSKYDLEYYNVPYKYSAIVLSFPVALGRETLVRGLPFLFFFICFRYAFEAFLHNTSWIGFLVLIKGIGIFHQSSLLSTFPQRPSSHSFSKASLIHFLLI